MNLNPIGFVESPVVEGVDENWGKVTSKIIIHEIFAPGLKGLNEYSHIIVIFYMHKSSFEPEDHLVRRPQDNENYPITGIFAQRAKHRPNFIGVTSVELLSIEDRVLTVRGLDAINSSPVLDIKPYFPAYDRRDAITPKWVNKIMKKYF
jgi:tRNA-Thr(GGU) m(6)t(6)A37 methyltransferase TsaA